jgi:hypothetical protein
MSENIATSVLRTKLKAKEQIERGQNSSKERFSVRIEGFTKGKIEEFGEGHNIKFKGNAEAIQELRSNYIKNQNLLLNHKVEYSNHSDDSLTLYVKDEKSVAGLVNHFKKGFDISCAPLLAIAKTVNEALKPKVNELTLG